ncbi:glycoside hydrolase [Pseudoneurospora amorphoporcata]|uniref:Glycoside hydrolase n=1 Tax=Pseudoneurospora amorphoporcata TaxID=241081 RepID=A0AAN6NN93_9PEZI|nr:glycoside hydrolase [Pseudoneurospora amorphoporcata]
MRYSSSILTATALALLPFAQAAKEVFAHFIVGNAPNYDLSDWQDDIALAQNASIDGFVLNIASQDASNANSLTNAFRAANAANFKLFFSFDYNAQAPWPKNDVTTLINRWANERSYFKPDNTYKPLVSTFEGPDHAEDWHDIKSKTNCLFIPDWSSLGPANAATKANSVADGLFSFDAWPKGPSAMTTEVDEQYREALSGRPYMMPVAGWFYTNLPGWNKNWLWKGDELWDTRWQQVIDFQPDVVEILTWNDYGESHYIGPVREKALGLFQSGNAPINYAENMPHDGWRKLLPYYIQQYKQGSKGQPTKTSTTIVTMVPTATSITTIVRTLTTIVTAPASSKTSVPFRAKVVAQKNVAVKEEAVVAYYRINPAKACNSGNTTGNDPNYQQVYAPDELLQDNIFITALLAEPADIRVSVGGKDLNATFSKKTPQVGGAGIYSGKVLFTNSTGDVVVTVSRTLENGTTVLIAEAKGGPSITTQCVGGMANWNPAVISS